MMNKKVITIVFALLNVSFGFAQRYAVHPSKKESGQLVIQADSLFYGHQLKASIQLYEQIAEAGEYSEDLLLNLAAMYSQENDIANCNKALNQVLDSGFLNLQHLTKSPEFQNFRNSGEWTNIAHRCHENFMDMVVKEKIKFPFLSGMLISMANDDQLALWRSELKNKHKHAYPDITLDSLDKINQQTIDIHSKILKTLFAKHGFLWEDAIGSKATHAVWLMVQHADSDISFQTDYLKAMKEALNNGKLIKNKKDYAYMYDRVQKNRKQPQLYGTQVSYQIITDEKTKKKTVKITPYTLEKPEGLDQRRKEMGLPPWKEYLKMMKELGGF